MSDKKIFIALSQREARSVLTATKFLCVGCSNRNEEKLDFSPENANVLGITIEEVCELMDFANRLEQLADQQAELEASIENQETTIQDQLTSNQQIS